MKANIYEQYICFIFNFFLSKFLDSEIRQSIFMSATNSSLLFFLFISGSTIHKIQNKKKKRKKYS
jgi:hypothetical protein